MSRRKRALVPEAQHALDNLKAEIATQLSVPNYDMQDKGALPARTNGSIGGEMVRRMIGFAENSIK